MASRKNALSIYLEKDTVSKITELAEKGHRSFSLATNLLLNKILEKHEEDAKEKSDPISYILDNL